MLLYDNIPEELKRLKNWCCFRFEERGGKKTKVPYSISGARCKSNVPETWNTYEEAIKALPNFDGLGFMFTPPYVGIDIDHCIDDSGKMSDTAQDIINTVGSYTEYSPSKTGVHIICKGSMPANGNRNTKNGIEMYSKGRFFTMTGNVIAKRPIEERQTEIENIHHRFIEKDDKSAKQAQPPSLEIEDNRIIEIARRSKSGINFNSLYLGDWNGSYNSQSEADLAFCNSLAFYTGKNLGQMDRIFRSSGLMRPKWDEQRGVDTYGNITLKKAIENCTDVYTPPAIRDFNGVTNKNTKSTDKGKTVCLEDIGTEKVAFLWWPYIPKGKLTIIQGDPGGGKTYSMLKIVAELSRGGKLPGDTKDREPIKILYQTAEDGYKDTINYRLQKMGANLSNIYMIDESETPLSFTDGRIENFLKEYKPGLMVFDPIQAYLGAGVDMHRANEIRPIMSHIIKLAEDYQCALAVIAHMSKMTQAAALYRNLGSIDITAAARSVLVVGRDPKDTERKIIAQVKSSTTKHGASIAFRINDTTGVEWDGYSDLEADDILNARRERKKKEAVSLEEAKSFLIETLGDKEYEKLEVIKTKAEETGISKSTLYDAKNELNIVSHSIGYGKSKIAWWSMDDIDKKDLPHEPEQTKLSDLPSP